MAALKEWIRWHPMVSQKDINRRRKKLEQEYKKMEQESDVYYKKFLLKLKKRNIREETDWPEDRFPFFKNLFYRIKTNLCISFYRYEDVKYDDERLYDTYLVCEWDYNEFNSDWGTSITWEEMVVGKGIFKNWHVYIFENGN